MKYSMGIGDKQISIEFSERFSSDEMELVKELMCKAIDTRLEELRKIEGNKLPITADIDKMYPELTQRTRNILKRNMCNTIEDVLNCTITELMRMQNMGKKSLTEIQDRFGKYGAFREEET